MEYFFLITRKYGSVTLLDFSELTNPLTKAGSPEVNIYVVLFCTRVDLTDSVPFLLQGSNLHKS